MARGKRSTIKRVPRTSGPASDCLVIRDGEVIGFFIPRPRPARKVKVVELPNGELITRFTDL